MQQTVIAHKVVYVRTVLERENLPNANKKKKFRKISSLTKRAAWERRPPALISASVLPRRASGFCSLMPTRRDRFLFPSALQSRTNCPIFLGGKEPTTLKELATALGKETIDTFNTGESRGREVSHSLNYQKLGKELMSVDELAVLDGGKCILQLRGVRPFLSDKYDITKHPNYKLTADFNERNTFDVQEYLQHRLKLKGDEVCSVYEADLPETTEAPDEAIPQN